MKKKRIEKRMEELQKTTSYNLSNANIFPQPKIDYNKLLNKNKRKIELELFKTNMFLNVKTYLEKRLFSLFEWKCDEKTLPAFLIEKYLSNFGMCCGFKDRNDFIILPCMPFEKRNVYGEFDKVYIFSFNGEKIGEKNLLNEEGILLRNDFNSNKTKNYIEAFATIITDTIVSSHTGVKNLKLPIILTTTAENESNAKDYLNRIYNDEPAVLTLKEFNLSNLQINENTYRAQNLQALRETIDYYIALFDELVGIPANKNIDKKERLTVGETDMLGSVEEINSISYKLRKEFCEKVKNRFDVNITCKYTLDEIQEKTTEGDDKNEKNGFAEFLSSTQI